MANENIDKHKYPSVHCGIVQAALILLNLEQHPAAKRFTLADTEILIKDAAAPDRIGDRQQGRGFHYYCAAKPDGIRRTLHPELGCYLNGRNAPAPSPLTMLQSEYPAALALHQAGRIPAAMRSLTRALHMLADICCPPHSCGLTYYSRYAVMHKRYEGRAAQLFWAERVPGGDSRAIARNWAGECRGNVPYQRFSHLCAEGSGTLTEICNRLAESGAAELPFVLGEDEAARDASITRRVKLSIVNCAALLAAFHSDLAESDVTFWQEKRPYWLCSARSPFAVSQSPLFLRFYEDGELSLSAEDGRYLAVTALGRGIMTASTAGCTTRFRFGREPVLTLYPNGDLNRTLCWIRGQLHICRRLALIQGAGYRSQISFLLTEKKPEGVHFLFP